VKLSNSIAKYALKICLPYAVVGFFWIIVSDRLLAWAVPDTEALTVLQTYKGWFFVIMSAFFIYLTSYHYIANFRDAERRLRESENARSESQRYLLTLLSNLPGMTYRCRNDVKWTMEFLSDGCLQLTGYNPDDIIENHFTAYGELILAEDQGIVWQSVQHAIFNKTPFQLEYRIKTKTGIIKWVWEQGRGVYSDQGELLAIEGYIVDISERKHLEEQLRNAERLQHVGQAASTIIHDMKNHMQVILGHVELFRINKEPAIIERHCDTIERQIQSMLSMSRELLEYARGEISLSLNSSNIDELLGQLVETYNPSFSPSGISLSYSHDQEPGASPTVEIDRAKIWRLLMNLIINAREALESGGTITIRSIIKKQDVSIEVQDTGPGIPESIKSRIFEPFVSFGKSGGTGLGLAIAKKIVEAHNGEISFVSKDGAGTTFIIKLPRQYENKLISEGHSQIGNGASL